MIAVVSINHLIDKEKNACNVLSFWSCFHFSGKRVKKVQAVLVVVVLFGGYLLALKKYIPFNLLIRKE